MASVGAKVKAHNIKCNQYLEEMAADVTLKIESGAIFNHFSSQQDEMDSLKLFISKW